MTAAALLARNKTRLTGRPVDLFLSFWCPIFPLPSEPRIRWFSGSFRHARQLAEGQKSADVQHFRIALPPPPPANRIGGVGQIPREKCRFVVIEAVIWRRGIPRLDCCPIYRDFEPAP